MNTVDGVLFPIGFALQNNIFGQIKRLIYEKDEYKDKDESIEIMEKREDEDEDDSGSLKNRE